MAHPNLLNPKARLVSCERTPIAIISPETALRSTVFANLLSESQFCEPGVTVADRIASFERWRVTPPIVRWSELPSRASFGMPAKSPTLWPSIGATAGSRFPLRSRKDWPRRLRSSMGMNSRNAIAQALSRCAMFFSSAIRARGILRRRCCGSGLPTRLRAKHLSDRKQRACLLDRLF